MSSESNANYPKLEYHPSMFDKPMCPEVIYELVIWNALSYNEQNSCLPDERNMSSLSSRLKADIEAKAVASIEAVKNKDRVEQEAHPQASSSLLANIARTTGAGDNNNRRGDEAVALYSPLDVLSGRGAMVNMHMGNRVFRRLVHMNRKRFQHLNHRDYSPTVRDKLVDSIIQAIQNHGGRFLKCEKGVWKPLSHRDAFAKTKQALRDKRDPQNRSSNNNKSSCAVHNSVDTSTYSPPMVRTITARTSSSHAAGKDKRMEQMANIHGPFLPTTLFQPKPSSSSPPSRKEHAVDAHLEMKPPASPAHPSPFTTTPSCHHPGALGNHPPVVSQTMEHAWAWQHGSVQGHAVAGEATADQGFSAASPAVAARD